ncbi:MAG: hypothetical protein ACOYBZ_09760 [Limnohabitans sp.]
MATKNTPPQKTPTPIHQPARPQAPEIRKYTPQGEGNVGYNQRENTVFQTRPVPPDPGDKK